MGLAETAPPPICGTPKRPELSWIEHQTTNLRVGRSNRSGRTISQKREKWGMSPDQVLGAFRTKSSSASWILFPLLRKAVVFPICCPARTMRSEEHTSELQSLMRNSYAVFCLKKKNK